MILALSSNSKGQIIVDDKGFTHPKFMGFDDKGFTHVESSLHEIYISGFDNEEEWDVIIDDFLFLRKDEHALEMERDYALEDSEIVDDV